MSRRRGVLPHPALRRQLSRRLSRRHLGPAGRTGAAAAPTEPSERALASAVLRDAGFAVATERALLTSPGQAGVGWQRLPWWQVDAARWDPDQHRLVVHATTDDGPRVISLDLAGKSLLPETVRERVQASIVVSERVALGGQAGARVVARRIPGEEEPRWRVILDPGLDAADPQVRAAADQALARLRAQMA